MASILRSGKFFRYFAGVTRSLVLNTHRETNGSVIKHSQALCTTFTQGFASIPANDQTLDRSIKKLDEDVRRTGRISRRYIEEVLDEIRLHRSASSSQSLLLLRCCGNLVPEELPEIRTVLVQKIWQTLTNLKVPMDVSHYNALLRVYLENEHPFSPTEFLADLESKGIEPNRVTFQRLITRYCQDGDIDGATKILEFMRAKQLPINEYVFNALILGHSEAGNMESAVGILSVMKESGLEPSPDTYTALLCAYAKHGEINEIVTTLDKCEANEIYLLDRDLFDIIYQLATNGHEDSVDKIIPRLRKSAGYNQDAVNVILRLVNKGQVDVGYKILKTMPRGTRPTGELADTGAFFIKQMVKSKIPAEKVLSICTELQQNGMNNRATLSALEAATTSGSVDIAVPFLREIQKSGLPLRQHYFWPLLCTQGKIDSDAVLDVVRMIQSEFQMTPNGETVRDYVIPNLKERNYEKMIVMLRSAGVTHSNAAHGCVYDALINGKTRDAALIASMFSIYYQPGLLRRPLVDALRRTNDYTSYISLLRSVYENLPRLQQLRNADAADEHADDIETQRQSEVLGQFVLDAVYKLPNSADVAQRILSALVEQGLSMSKFHAQRIQERLGSSLTPELSTLLEKLTAGDLEPVPYESRASRVNYSDISADQLEKLIQRKEANGENTKGLYRTLLLTYFKANDVTKSEELLAKLEATDFVFTSGVYAHLIELYCNSNDLEKALAVHQKIISKEPDFELDDLKKIKIVQQFVINDRIDDAIQFLNANKRAEKSEEERGFAYNTLCWRILNLLADKGKDDDVAKMFNALEENNFAEVNNVLLGPLVKVHLVNNDVKKAMEAFESISTKYDCTPFKNDLACRLIQSEDSTNLQLLTDLSTNVHGEVNSLYDLVFAFIECGRIRQARKILETPGLRSRPQRINERCERYRREGKSEPLEALVQATRDLNHIDRHEIFYNLLLTYCKEDAPEKALGLWMKIQEEEDVTPSDQFLNKLATFLKEKGLEVPFVVPTSTEKLNQRSDVDVDAKKVMKASGNVAKNPPKFTSSVTAESNLVETMVQENRLDDATKQVEKMLASNTHPLPRTFRFYLNKIAAAGSYELIERLSPLLSAETKRLVSFDNRLCNAYMQAGKGKEYIDQMIKSFDNATSKEQLDELVEKFPRGTMSSILSEYPELLETFDKFANQMAEKGILAPINIMWMCHIENGKLDQADRIMKNFLSDTPRIMFNHTLRVARERNDVTIVKNLLESLKGAKVTESALGTVHSCLIDVYCAQEMYNDALNAVDNAIKDVCLENINRTALGRVKDGLAAAGKNFPHTIPNKKKANAAESSSSSSSSDDEPPVKK